MTDLAGKQVLVTGATGFLGTALSLRLAKEGARVKGLARRPEKANALQQTANIELVAGDINDADRVHEVTQDCEFVFHVAAALGGSMDKQRKVNVDGTRNVMLAAANAQVRRVVHVSTVAVYGYEYLADVTEDMAHKPGPVPYNRTKSEGEEVVREVGEAHSLSYSIVRPGMIYGPRANTWTKTLFQVAQLKPTPFLGDGSGSTYPIYVDDLVDLMTVLATHPAADGQAFNCAPDPAPSWREFLGGYSRLAGHNRWLSLPVWPIKLVAPLVEAALAAGGEPQDFPLIIPFMLAKKSYKMTKARALLGWQPQVSLQDGIERCAPWLREKGLLV